MQVAPHPSPPASPPAVRDRRWMEAFISIKKKYMVIANTTLAFGAVLSIVDLICDVVMAIEYTNDGKVRKTTK